ncbi:50S ribosomal protein L32 [Candidatus Falkowbacteria bacterium]|uniref:Large ribosomal subunit protein bL32 n=1 Tax=Candidatus Buchananbacteria bacterium CG10_big_fil_rev_8_21_14_0_10_33_19 TaxID=1974525 RepID=A0A2H0W530_9BACT|nr:50S ribosomal protein L32 [Candidatus Falkowbacteria bacterium]PIS06472.1 MAG: 50S ribosomal protein L32 [Candidatus Buchananbacteria bacterium CG10_big_fil_rev_8_21_14_0_10_33_19]
MSVPTQRRTKSARLRRASHFALKKTNLVKCQKCGKPTLPHTVCESCGTYKGKQVINLKDKKKTLKQKDQDRKEAAKKKAEKKESKKK